MNFQQLNYIRATVQNNFNLTEVAHVLFTSQSGVSKQIKELEAELGVEIFVRRGKRLTGLTEAGESAVAQVERVLFELENLKRLSKEFIAKDSGRLVIVSTHNQSRYVLPKVIQRFTKLYPHVQLELRQVTPRTAAQALSRGQADIGVATEALDEFPELETFPCFDWEHVVVVRRDHPLAALDLPTFADVAAYPIITYTQGFSGRAKIDATFQGAQITPDVRLTAMDTDVIKAYVEMGMGVGIISEMSLSDDPCSPLVALPRDNLKFETSTTKVAIQRGALLRSYAYSMIEMLAPQLTFAAPKNGIGRRQPKPATGPLPSFAVRTDLQVLEHEAPPPEQLEQAVAAA